jgi:hypothetical protein
MNNFKIIGGRSVVSRKFIENAKILGATIQNYQYSGTNVMKFLFSLFIIIFSGSAAQRGVWSRLRGFLVTHNDAPQSVGLFWTSDRLVPEIST